MASLDKNSIWSDISSGASVSDSVMGPTYSYADNIQGPASMGVGSRGTISQLTTNTGAIINYVKYMISGPAMGNQYFVNTGGVCIDSDKNTQPRYNYINNIADGADLLPQSMKDDLGGIASDFNGLIPGMLEDTENLNPVHLLSALAADSTPTCECYSCPVSGGTESKFMNTGLSPDYDPAICTKVDNSKCVTSTEGFQTSDNLAMPVLIVFGITLLAQLL
jgi:hypothetical protein